jgi:hypothetical protein
MIQTNETHNKIIIAIKNNGPSLPIHIAKKINMSSLFVSAFLSELITEKKVKISNLKVGGSHLYFLEGQEEQLEKFYTYLHPKEAEAFLLLKEKKMLKDSEQEPAIRVALRNIGDFAVGFRKNNEIYWRYFTVPEAEFDKIIIPETKPVIKIVQVIEEKPLEKIEAQKVEPQLEKIEKIKEKPQTKKEKSEEKIPEPVQFNNPLALKPEKKEKKEKSRSKFVLKVIETIKEKNFKIIQEIDYKLKEYHCIVQMPTNLGPISFLGEAKDKKKLAEADLEKLLSKAQAIPLPALIIYPKELDKKAREYAEKYHSILKTLKIS